MPAVVGLGLIIAGMSIMQIFSRSALH